VGIGYQPSSPVDSPPHSPVFPAKVLMNTIPDACLEEGLPEWIQISGGVVTAMLCAALGGHTRKANVGGFTRSKHLCRQTAWKLIHLSSLKSRKIDARCIVPGLKIITVVSRRTGRGEVPEWLLSLLPSQTSDTTINQYRSLRIMRINLPMVHTMTRAKQ
jgi:hypothetical protein